MSKVEQRTRTQSRRRGGPPPPKHAVRKAAEPKGASGAVVPVLLAGGVLLGLLLCGGVVAGAVGIVSLALWSGGSSEETVAVASPDAAMDFAPEPVSPEPLTVDEEFDPLELIAEEDRAPGDAPVEPAPEALPDADEVALDEPPPPEPERAFPKPFEEILTHERRLPLPEDTKAIGATNDPVELCHLYVRDLKECGLTLSCPVLALKPGRSVVVRQQDEEDGTRCWRVATKAANAVDGNATEEVATFILAPPSGEPMDGHKLIFTWAESPLGGQRSLRLDRCLLNLKVGEETVRCQLTSPRETAPIPIQFDREGATFIDLPIGAHDLEDQVLEVSLWLDGVAHEPESISLESNESGVFTLFDPDVEGDVRFVDCRVTLLVTESVGIKLEGFGFPKTTTGGEIRYFRLPLQAESIDDLGRECGPKWPVTLKQKREKTKLEKKLDQLIENVSGVDAEIKKLKSQVRVAERSAAPTGFLTSQLERKIRYYQEDVRSPLVLQAQTVHGEIEKLDRELQVKESNLAWCAKVTTFLEQLEEKRRLHYELCLVFDGEKIPLLRTKGDASQDQSEP